MYRKRRYRQTPRRAAKRKNMVGAETSLISRIFNRFLLRYWIIGGAVVLALIIAAVVVSATRAITPEETALYGKTTIKIGVGTDCASFGSVTADNEVSGFEKDAAEAVFGELYPDAKLAFEPIAQQEASYLLKNGEIDAALAMLPANVLKTEGLSLSNGIFKDSVYPFVLENSTLTSTRQLQGKTLYVLSSDINVSEIKKALTEMGFTNKIVECTSYPDAITALRNGTADVVLAPKYKMQRYEDGIRQLVPKIIDLNYRIVLWTDNSDSLEPINGRIKEMKNDGTLSGLREKWNLEEDNSDNSELRENKGDTKVVVVEENAATATAAASASAS